jgi:hypothetical protein
MRATDLDDVVPFLRFGGDCITQRRHRWNQALLDVDGGPAMLMVEGNESFAFFEKIRWTL